MLSSKHGFQQPKIFCTREDIARLTAQAYAWSMLFGKCVKVLFVKSNPQEQYLALLLKIMTLDLQIIVFAPEFMHGF